MSPSVLTSVKLAIYETIANTAQAPVVSDIAKQLNLAHDQVQAAFDELHKQRLLVPEPGDPTRIRMAPPFSGIETSFRVIVRDTVYFAPCAWDMLGIPAALHQDAVIHASDGHTREPMTIVVRGGAPAPEPCAIHFAVPAAHWWDDIIYT
jgi:DNA-binding transcriptional MocR family regulator